MGTIRAEVFEAVSSAREAILVLSLPKPESVRIEFCTSLKEFCAVVFVFGESVAAEFVASEESSKVSFFFFAGSSRLALCAHDSGACVRHQHARAHCCRCALLFATGQHRHRHFRRLFCVHFSRSVLLEAANQLEEERMFHEHHAGEAQVFLVWFFAHSCVKFVGLSLIILYGLLGSAFGLKIAIPGLIDAVKKGGNPFANIFEFGCPPPSAVNNSVNDTICILNNTLAAVF